MFNNKKVMISLDDFILSDIDYQAKRIGLSRSAFIRFIFINYMFNNSSDYEIKSLKDESTFEDLK